jgi:hypothetical protein
MIFSRLNSPERLAVLRSPTAWSTPAFSVA